MLFSYLSGQPFYSFSEKRKLFLSRERKVQNRLFCSYADEKNEQFYKNGKLLMRSALTLSVLFCIIGKRKTLFRPLKF